MSSGIAIETQACPTCRRTLNRTSEAPGPGTLTVCAYCAAPLRFVTRGADGELELERVEIEALEGHAADVMREAVNRTRRHILARRARWN